MSPPPPLDNDAQGLDLEMTLELPMADPRLSRVAATVGIDSTQALPVPEFSGVVYDETAELRVLPASLAPEAVTQPPARPAPQPATASPAPAATGVFAQLERNLRDVADRLSVQTQRAADLQAELAQQREQAAARLELLQSQAEARRHEESLRLVAAADREVALREELAQTRRSMQAQREEFEARIERFAHLQAVAEQQQALMARELAQNRLAAERQLEQLRGREGRQQLERGALEDQASRIISLQAELAEQTSRHQAAHALQEAGRLELDRQVAAGSRAIAELARERTDLLEEVASLRSQLAQRDERLAVIEARARADATALASLQQTLESLGLADAPGTEADTSPPDDAALIAARPTLLWEEEGGTREHLLGARTTLGRTADNDIVLDATFASRHHAVILREGGQLRIEDLNSTNGLRVNGHRVMQQLLQDGDIITIGKTVFRCVYRIAE